MTLRRVTNIFTSATIFRTVPGGILKTILLNVYEYYVLHVPEYLGYGLARELLRIICPRYYYAAYTSSEILHRSTTTERLIILCLTNNSQSIADGFYVMR